MTVFRPYRVTARNPSADSDNKIHDDEVARRYGFAGGLVPGVVVHAYLCHPPVERWGLDWLNAGRIHARIEKPVYDGDCVVIESDAAEKGLVARRDGAGEQVTAAVAEIYSPGESGDDGVDLSRFPHLPLPSKDERPPASEEAFRAHPVLGAVDAHFRGDLAGYYLDAIGETDPIYRREGIAHPGWLIAQANYVLAANVALGPWIHVESDVRYLGLVHDGDLVSTRAVVAGTAERRGHRFVDLDVLIVDGTERPVAYAHHVAIYQPRL